MNDARKPMKPPPHPPSAPSADLGGIVESRIMKVLAALLLASLAAVFVYRAPLIWESLLQHTASLFFWAVLIAVLGFLPLLVEDFLLTFDLPILLAVAILFQPEVAAALCFVASVDLREIRRRVGAWRALFNRSQIALSILAASSAFHLVAGGLRPWPRALLGTGLALGAEYLVNVGLVGLHVSLRRGISLHAAVKRLHVGGLSQFLFMYLAYGFLALVLANLFMEIGAWSVVGFIVPILVARQALMRTQELEKVSGELREREIALERMFDQVIDERRDERLRIAGDLHDETFQELTRAWLTARGVAGQVELRDSLAEEFHEIVRAIELATRSVRTVIGDLRESVLGRTGLVGSLDSLVRDLRIRFRGEVAIVYSQHFQVADLPPDIQVVVYQLVREALTNAVRHADATRITVAIDRLQGSLEIAVEDDGVGFEPSLVDSTSHFGLGLMEARTQRVAGVLVVESARGKGTRLRASLPIPESPEPRQVFSSAATNATGRRPRRAVRQGH